MLHYQKVSSIHIKWNLVGITYWYYSPLWMESLLVRYIVYIITVSLDQYTYLIEELVHIWDQCWVVNNAQFLMNRV